MEHSPAESQDDHEFVPPDATERCSMGCVAVLFGLLAFWIAWIAANFLDGRGWFDFVVRMVLDEVVLAVGLLSLTLLIWAVFAPAKMAHIFEAVSVHVAKAAAIFFVVLIAPWLLFAMVWSLLSASGIVR